MSPADPALPSVLDRVIPFVGATPWQTTGWAAALAVAVAVRLLRLDDWALGTGEAARAYGAWALFRGQPPVAGDSSPDVGALVLLLHGIGFFLFGTTDVIARLVPALAGIVIVALPLTLRRWVGGPAALGMAASGGDLTGARLRLTGRLRGDHHRRAGAGCGRLSRSPRRSRLLQSTRGPAIALGIISGAAYAAGASAITVMVSVIVGVAAAALSAPDGTIRRGLRALRREAARVSARHRGNGRPFASPASSPTHPVSPGLAGQLGAWWRLLTESSGQPAALFLMVLLVYEPVAVVFAIAAVVRNRGDRGDALVLFAGWWVTAFTIWSFAAGHEAEHAVHVALPLVLLGAPVSARSCTPSTGMMSGTATGGCWPWSCSASSSAWGRLACCSPGSTTRAAD